MLLRPDVLVFLSGPMAARYGFTLEENLAAALKVYMLCLEAGYPAFCPHLAGMIPSSMSLTLSRWLEYDLAMLSRCTHVLMLPRWQQSIGAQLEKARAEELQIPVVYTVGGLQLLVAGEREARLA